MILFSSSGSQAGGIAKVILAVGAAIVGIFRTCGRSADEVVDVAKLGRRGDQVADLRYTDDLTDLRHADDVWHSTKGGLLKLDDAYALTEETAKARKAVFEVRYLDELDEASPIVQSYFRWKDHTPGMSLKMMQIELMPPSVRRVLMEPGGDELYSAMMGRKIDAQEAEALRHLFGPSVHATEKSAEKFVYLREAVEEGTTTKLIDFEKQLHNAEMPDKNIMLKNVEVSTPDGARVFEEATANAGKAVFDHKTTISEWLPNLKTCMKLIKLGVKFVHHAQSYAGQKDKKAVELSYLIYAPESDEELMKHYLISEQEVKYMRDDLKKLSKLKWVHIITELTDLNSYTNDSGKEYIMVCRRENMHNNSTLYNKHFIWLNIDGYSFNPKDEYVISNRSVCFEPLAKAMLSTKINKDTPSTSMFEQLAGNYVDQINAENRSEVQALVYINAQFTKLHIGYSPLFQVVYSDGKE